MTGRGDQAQPKQSDASEGKHLKSGDDTGHNNLQPTADDHKQTGQMRAQTDAKNTEQAKPHLPEIHFDLAHSAGDIGNAVSSLFGKMQHTVSDASKSMAHGVSDTAKNVAHTANDVVDKISHASADIAKSAESFSKHQQQEHQNKIKDSQKRGEETSKAIDGVTNAIGNAAYEGINIKTPVGNIHISGLHDAENEAYKTAKDIGRTIDHGLQAIGASKEIRTQVHDAGVLGKNAGQYAYGVNKGLINAIEKIPIGLLKSGVRATDDLIHHPEDILKGGPIGKIAENIGNDIGSAIIGGAEQIFNRKQADESNLQNITGHRPETIGQQIDSWIRVGAGLARDGVIGLRNNYDTARRLYDQGRSDKVGESVGEHVVPGAIGIASLPRLIASVPETISSLRGMLSSAELPVAGATPLEAQAGKALSKPHVVESPAPAPLETPPAAPPLEAPPAAVGDTPAAAPKAEIPKGSSTPEYTSPTDPNLRTIRGKINQEEILGKPVKGRGPEFKDAGQYSSVQAPEQNIASKSLPKESAPMEKPRLQTGSEAPQPKDIEYKPSHPDNPTIHPGSFNVKQLEEMIKAREAGTISKPIPEAVKNTADRIEAESPKVPKAPESAPKVTAPESTPEPIPSQREIPANKKAGEIYNPLEKSHPSEQKIPQSVKDANARLGAENTASGAKPLESAPKDTMPEGAPPRDHTDIFGKSQERAANYKTNPDGSVEYDLGRHHYREQTIGQTKVQTRSRVDEQGAVRTETEKLRPDGARITIREDGSVSERLANGAVNEYNRDGDLIPHLSRPARPVQNEIEIPQNIYAEPGRLD